MADDEKVPVAVVGAGNMGSNHIRVYDELPGAELVEVVEKDPDTASEVRKSYDVDVLESVDGIEKAEATTVAIPNHLHKDVTVECIEKGLDVLVEKPLAEEVDEAREIIDAAEENDAVLQVGHIERFNPAVQLLQELLEKQDLVALEAHRLGPFNEHLLQTSVIFDLMIHDVDIIESIVDSEVSTVDAVGTKKRSEELDYVTANLKFENGVVGTVTGSHVTHGKVRKLEATTVDSYISLDYQKQEITLQRRGTEQTETTILNRAGYRTEVITEHPYVNNREPLKNELEHFVECVKERRDPLVNGKDGLHSIKRLNQISDIIN